MRTTVTYKGNDIPVEAHLYVPDDWMGQTLPGVVCCHPAGGVKEQTAGFYAEELSKLGYATIAFDAVRQGASAGEPRALEDPFQRAEDIRGAVSYLATRSFVDADRIGVLGVCAGSCYAAYTAQTDYRIKAVATVSAVDPAVELLADPGLREFLIAQTGVLRNLEMAGDGPFLTHVNPGTSAEAEGYPERSMFRECYDYYMEGPNVHPNSTGWGLMRYDVLAHFAPFAHMEWIAPRPLLMIVGDEADTTHFTDEALAIYDTNGKGAKGEKFVVAGASHMDLYREEHAVRPAIQELDAFFGTHLGK